MLLTAMDEHEHQVRHAYLVPLLLTILIGCCIILVTMLSMLCWRRFRNLSLREQFLDYREVPVVSDKEDKIENSITKEKPTENGHVEELIEKPIPVLRQVQRGPMKHYAKQPPPPWTPKPELNVVSVQPLDNDKEDGDADPISSSTDDDEGGTSPIEMAAPYDLRDATPIEEFTAPSDADFLGRIYFSLQYDAPRAVLVVRILKGEEFPPYLGQAPDVFMEAKLSPTMKNGQLKTEIHERTSHPSFNEIFEFGLSYDEIRKQTLQFALSYMDKYSHPFHVGEVTHPLDHLDKGEDDILKEEMIVCREIQKISQKDDATARDLGYGQILFSLMYMPLTRRLTIVIFKARDLKSCSEGIPAVYVEVVMVNTLKRIRKRKATTVKTGTLSPVYNEAMAFDVANMKLDDVKLQVFVKQKMEGVPHKLMGRVVLGSNVEGFENEHWMEAMNAKKPIAHWHSLSKSHLSISPAKPRKTKTMSFPCGRNVERFLASSSESEG